MKMKKIDIIKQVRFSSIYLDGVVSYVSRSSNQEYSSFCLYIELEVFSVWSVVDYQLFSSYRERFMFNSRRFRLSLTVSVLVTQYSSGNLELTSS